MFLIIYYYSQIVSHVINHERALREQAKKMNVESLRSNASTNAQTAEIRIAKVFSIYMLYLLSHTRMYIHIYTHTHARTQYIRFGKCIIFFS